MFAKHEVQRRGRARHLVLHACCSCDDPGFLAVLFEILFIWGHSRESALRLECTRAREDKRGPACRTARPADDDPLCAGNIARTRMIVTTSARRTASLSPDRACRAIVHFPDQGRTPRFDKVFCLFFPQVLAKTKTVQAPSPWWTRRVRQGPGTCGCLGRGARPR